jgi:hypothetical protein
MFKHLLLFVIGFFVSMAVQAQPFTHPDHGFVSWKPAPRWEDALLSGNGTMGTLMFGEPHDETIIVNHALSYLPQRVPLQPIDQASRLAEIRALLARGKFVEAARIPVEQSMKEGYGEKHWIDPYVPVCDIKLSMTPGNVSDYIRMVDFETGEAKVQWRQDGQLFQRSLFVSRADSVMVMKITSTGKVNVRLSLRQHPVNWDQWDYINNAIKYTNVSAQGNYLTYSTAFNHHFKGIPYGFEGTALVYNVGGTKKTEGSHIVVTDADEVLVLMAVAPDFKNKASLQTYLQQWLTTIKPDYATLLEGQKRTHGELFGRVKLSLGKDANADLQSEAFVETARQGVTLPMIQKEFDAARYNIISSTGINPPNLQGIWSGTWTPPWSSGFTHDGNVEVAVSHLLSANTPELMASYLHYHERMMPWYRDNARRLFGTRGIVVPAHSSSHGWNIHFDETWTLSLWTAGAGWTAGILYDYYLYTGNIDMLEKHIYPFMREAAWFYEDFMIKGDDGKYLFSPSYSPENNPANSPSQLVVNATMDVMVAKDLLRNCIDAGKIVGETSQQIHKWEQMLTLMPDYRINTDGELVEWLPKNFEENHSHRHVSQLYALFDRMAPEFVRDTVLRNAAHKTLEARMAQRRRNNGGEMVFGLAQQGMVAANLGDAALTGEIIDLMAQYYWAPSFATYHNAGNLFNMDLSGGFPAVIIRSLVYSEPGSIWLLPALSPNWETGAIEGIALRGQIIVNRLEWSRNDVVVRLTSAIDQRVMVQLPKICSQITASPKAAALKVDCSKNYFFLRMKKGVPVTVTLSY